MKRDPSADLTVFVRAAREDAPSNGELEAMAGALAIAASLGPLAASAKAAASTTVATAKGASLSTVGILKMAGLGFAVASAVSAGSFVALRAPSEPVPPPVSSAARLASSRAAPEAPREVPPLVAPVVTLAELPPEVPSPSRQRRELRTEEPSSGDEAALIDRARSTLRSDPGAALALVHEHRARFPRGIAAPEAGAIEIEALALLGQIAQARALLAAFERREPSSFHVKRLRQRLNRIEGRPSP